MKINQLSIFLENREGRLWHSLDLLANENINIRALSLADTSEFGILRVIVQDPEKAKKILEDNNFIVKIKKIIAVEISDNPGGLASVLKVLNINKINLEYIYTFTHEKCEKTITSPVFLYQFPVSVSSERSLLHIEPDEKIRPNRRIFGNILHHACYSETKIKGRF